MSKPELKRIQFVPIFFAFSFGMVLSTLLNQNRPVNQAPEAFELAYRGIDKTREELPTEIAQQLQTEEQAYLAKRKSLLETAGLRFYLHDYAQNKQLELEQAAEQLFAVEAPGDEEITAFFNANKAAIDKPFYQVRDAIAQTLGQQKRNEKREQRLQDLLDRGDLIIYLK